MLSSIKVLGETVLPVMYMLVIEGVRFANDVEVYSVPFVGKYRLGVVNSFIPAPIAENDPIDRLFGEYTVPVVSESWPATILVVVSPKYYQK